MLTFPPRLVPRLPTLILIDVPEAETPSQHIRNGLMLLSLLKEQSPATWALNPDLQRAALRATAAMVILDFHGPADLAQRQLRTAIEALLATDLEWEVITEVPAACARFFSALFALEEPTCLSCGLPFSTAQELARHAQGTGHGRSLASDLAEDR